LANSEKLLKKWQMLPAAWLAWEAIKGILRQGKIAMNKKSFRIREIFTIIHNILN
jgi:hypothetical protein